MLECEPDKMDRETIQTNKNKFFLLKRKLKKKTKKHFKHHFINELNVM